MTIFKTIDNSDTYQIEVTDCELDVLVAACIAYECAQLKALEFIPNTITESILADTSNVYRSIGVRLGKKMFEARRYKLTELIKEREK